MQVYRIRTYPVMTVTQKYLNLNGNSIAVTQFQDRPSANKFSTSNNQQVDLLNKQHYLQDQQGSIKANQNEVTGRVTKSSDWYEIVKAIRLVRRCTNWSMSNQHVV